MTHMQEAVDLWEVEQKFKNNPAIAPTAITPLALGCLTLRLIKQLYLKYSLKQDGLNLLSLH